MSETPSLREEDCRVEVFRSAADNHFMGPPFVVVRVTHVLSGRRVGVELPEAPGAAKLAAGAARALLAAQLSRAQFESAALDSAEPPAERL